MANSLIVFPFPSDDSVPDLLARQGIVVADLPDGLAPTREQAVAALQELDWPFSVSEADPSGSWAAEFGGRDGSYPPISEMRFADHTLTFRLGPLFGPWEVVRRVAARCGPQVALEASCARVALVTPTTSYEEFHQRLYDRPAPADGSDREWSRPVSEAERVRFQSSPLYDPTIEDSLEYAAGGGVGRGSEAMNVGYAIQAFRWHPKQVSSEQVSSGSESGSGSGRRAPEPHHRVLDEARCADVVERLRDHLAQTPVPIPELVWAFGQSHGAADDLRRLVARLDGVPDADRTREMAELFLRSGPP